MIGVEVFFGMITVYEQNGSTHHYIYLEMQVEKFIQLVIRRRMLHAHREYDVQGVSLH